MSLPKSEVRNVSTTYEKSGDVGQLEPNSTDLYTPPEFDPPDGGFQAWATVFGRQASLTSVTLPTYSTLAMISFLMQFCGFGYVVPRSVRALSVHTLDQIHSIFWSLSGYAKTTSE